MFSTFRQRLILGVYIFIILSIPVGAYLVSQFQTFNSSASEIKTKRPVVDETSDASASAKKAAELNDTLKKLSSSPDPVSTPEPTTTLASSFGPTLSLKVILEGRPANDQSGKVFLGISEGIVSTNPKFLLNYTLDLPKSGQYTNISLAGLTVGTQYTALLKGPTQIATTSAFIMSPNVTTLNEGNPLTLLTGDLNEDNIVNSSDYSVAQRALGSKPSSPNWNENADFNKDGIVNLLDLAYITKNFGRTGGSGAWYSTSPKVATSSGGIAPPPAERLSTPSGGIPEGKHGGYWMWVPN